MMHNANNNGNGNINGSGNKRRLQTNLPAPQCPQGMHTVSRSMGSLGGYTVNQNNAIRNNINLSINNKFNVTPQAGTNMNQFNQNATGNLMQNVQTQNGADETILKIPTNLSQPLNQQQLWAIYQQQMQAKQEQ